MNHPEFFSTQVLTSIKILRAGDRSLDKIRGLFKDPFMQTYHYVLASSKYLLEEEPLQEVIDERHRYYKEKNKDVDFWLVQQPAFVDIASMAEIKAKCPQPCTAVISTNQQFIQWLKLRLEYVHMGQFDAPTEELPNAIASLASV